MKCKCESSGKIVLGKTTAMPTKHKTLIDSKNHPLCGRPYATISLFKCDVCGQHWQADGMQGRVRSGISWPLVCIKIDDPENWQKFDDYLIRKAFFPELDNKVKIEPGCATEKCNGSRVRGLDYCPDCAVKLRQKGVEVLSFEEK